MKLLLFVAAGGAVGSVGRYLTMSLVGQGLGIQYPFGTLVVNVLGAFFLGSLVEIMALAWSPSEEIRAFMAIGLLGGFTTFSTFSMDMFYLMESGHTLGTGIYVASSVMFSVLAFKGGLVLFRYFLA